MVHLLVLTIIKSFDIDIQVLVDLDDGEAIVGGKASFDHAFHGEVMDAASETIVAGMMMALDDGDYLVALFEDGDDFFGIADT